MAEQRGPIEKSEKGWPINPFGVVALVIFALVVVFLIVRPLIKQKATVPVPLEQGNAAGGKIVSPQAGEIIRSDKVSLELDVDDGSNVEKVQFWAKTYADGRWQVVGEASGAPFKLEWTIPAEFQNKAIALTSHIYQKDGEIIKDPGGWREGIIILSQ